MNQEVTTLTPSGQALAQSLGFQAFTVIVDNFTSSYITLPDAGKTIPPWVYGAVVALPPGVRRATAKLTPTTPAIPGPPVPASQATLTWTDQSLPADPGHLLQQVTTQQAVVLGSVISPANSTNTGDFPVPAGTQSIGFCVRSEAIPGEGAGHFYETPASTTVTGDQTQNNYFEAITGATNAGGPLAAVFDPSDTSVTVSMTAAAGDQSKVDVLAWPSLPSVRIRQNPGDLPIGVAIMTGSGTIEFLNVDGGLSGTAALLGVSLADAASAPWQSAHARAFSEVSNGTWPVTLVAGVAGKTIYVHSWELEVEAAANRFVKLYDDSVGNPNGTFAKLFATAGEVTGTGSGGPLTLGAGVKVTSSAINGEFVDAILWYTQQ